MYHILVTCKISTVETAKFERHLCSNFSAELCSFRTSKILLSSDDKDELLSSDHMNELCNYELKNSDISSELLSCQISEEMTKLRHLETFLKFGCFG